MAMTMITMRKIQAVIILSFSFLSFIFGIATVSFLEKACFETPVTIKDDVVRKFSHNRIVLLMVYLSVVFLVATNVAGCVSLFDLIKSFPPETPFMDHKFSGVFITSLTSILTGLIGAMSLVPTITIQGHLSHKIHHDLKYDCRSDSPVLLTVGAVCSLVLGLFWCLVPLSPRAGENFRDEDSEMRNVNSADLAL